MEEEEELMTEHPEGKRRDMASVPTGRWEEILSREKKFSKTRG
jgi:hypothetical protein